MVVFIRIFLFYQFRHGFLNTQIKTFNFLRSLIFLIQITALRCQRLYDKMVFLCFISNNPSSIVIISKIFKVWYILFLNIVSVYKYNNTKDMLFIWVQTIRNFFIKLKKEKKKILFHTKKWKMENQNMNMNTHTYTLYNIQYCVYQHKWRMH